MSLAREINMMNQIREDLALNEPPFDDIDPALLLQVLIWKRGRMSREITKFIENAQVPSADELEFIGDAVLHIIFTMSVAEYPLTVGQLSNFRSILERNSNLSFYGDRLELCWENLSIKGCADIFEALIGAMYLHLFYGKNMRYCSIDYIETWLMHLGYEEQLREVLPLKTS